MAKRLRASRAPMTEKELVSFLYQLRGYELPGDAWDDWQIAI